MTQSKTPQHLADAIESLVASYVDELRRTAQEAIDRSFVNPAIRTSATKRRGREKSAPPAKRRTTEQLNDLYEQLYALVCARPGETMAVFANETGVAAKALHRPMSKLKADGRIRSVGERNMTRYFPAVGRTRNGG